MTSFFSNLSWNKEYAYFNDQGQLAHKQLNFFQRRLRDLGFYSNTHLAKVAETAQKACFDPSRNWSDTDKKEIAAIITQARLKNILKPSLLGTKTLESGEKVSYLGLIGRYGYTFWVRVEKKDKPSREALIDLGTNIGKTKNSEDLKKVIVQQLYERNSPDNDNFIINPDDILAKTTYVFLSKLLQDSKKVTELDMSVAGPVGGALVAEEYGFKGTAQRYFEIEGKKIGDPAGFKLEKQNVKIAQLATQLGLNSPASLDFWIS